MVPEIYTNDQDEMQFKSLVIQEGTVNLDGFTRFAFYAKKVDLVITDGYTDNFLACTAELIFNDKQNFVLNTKESFILPDGGQMLIREVSFNGKMTPSGQFKFSWPETWIEMGEVKTDILGQLREHTGYEIHGPGISNNTINYKGSFDDEKFYAEMHLIGLQEKPGTLPFFLEMVEGPVETKFIIDLKFSN